MPAKSAPCQKNSGHAQTLIWLLVFGSAHLEANRLKHSQELQNNFLMTWNNQGPLRIQICLFIFLTAYFHLFTPNLIFRKHF